MLPSFAFLPFLACIVVQQRSRERGTGCPSYSRIGEDVSISPTDLWRRPHTCIKNIPSVATKLASGLKITVAKGLLPQSFLPDLCATSVSLGRWRSNKCSKI